MFLCTLSVLVSLVVANSSAHQEQLEAIESPVTRNRYIVSQEIRNQVPVDFAALNLRKSRLKHQSDKITSRHRPELEKPPNNQPIQSVPNNQPKHINVMKNLYKSLKYRKHKGQARKMPNDKSVDLKKTSERPIAFSTEIIIASTKTPMVESKPTKNSEHMRNSLVNINRAINALPQQIVTIVKDEIDCNDDPTKNLENVRGPPCNFSQGWPGTDGHSSFWMKNAFPQNWAAFTE